AGARTLHLFTVGGGRWEGRAATTAAIATRLTRKKRIAMRTHTDSSSCFSAVASLGTDAPVKVALPVGSGGGGGAGGAMFTVTFVVGTGAAVAVGGALVSVGCGCGGGGGGGGRTTRAGGGIALGGGMPCTNPGPTG